MRCWGINTSYKRCANKQDYPFCRHHYLQPIGSVMFLILLPICVNLSSSYIFNQLSPPKSVDSEIKKFLLEEEIERFEEGNLSKNQLDSLIKNSQRDVEKFIEELSSQNSSINEKLINVKIPIHIKLLNIEVNNEILDKINTQIKIINSEFLKHGISFFQAKIENITDIQMVSDDNHLQHKLKYLESFIDKNSQSSNEYLNLYITDLHGIINLAGMPFPNSIEKSSITTSSNYIIINKESLPGGTLKPYNEGKAIFDVIGHWLGLYHTFTGGCDKPGDYVEDTPAHLNPTYGPIIQKACNESEFLPIHNYMNYVPDSLMNNYTRGQVQRMKICLFLFRNQFLDESHYDVVTYKKHNYSSKRERN